MQWIWQHPDWPKFQYDEAALQGLLYEYGKSAGIHAGAFERYPEPLQTDLMLDIITSEALTTSAIEGETLHPDDIRSSLRNQLGLENHFAHVPDKRAEGIASMMLLARNTFASPLSQEMLFKWHELLMMGVNPYLMIMVGHWRIHEEPMQIVSGPIGRQRVHFEAPHSKSVPDEMKRFIKWFNASESKGIPGPIRAAIAHLYFETIHPFQDGNGRIGRTIAEKALSQDLGAPILSSISTSINKNKKAYYDALSQASKKSLEITPWIEYFLHLLMQAQQDTAEIIDYTIKKAQFWKKYEPQLNERQTKCLKRMLKEGRKGFEGGISAKKYEKLTDVSKATATRDLADLLAKGCLKKLPGEGRNTRYDINMNI